jgi:RNA polymerase sigma factor (sigma-70 family)
MTRGSQSVRKSIVLAIRWTLRHPAQLRTNDNERPKAKVEWADLIGRIASHGDRDAFRLLFEHFAPRVKGLILKAGASGEEAEEIAQDTLLAVWRKAAQFDPASAGASAWIFTIARNLRIDAVRRSARAGVVVPDAELEYFADPADSQETQIARQEEAARISAALALLSTEQSAAIRMSFLEDRPHSEIAETLQIPLGTVKSRIRLAMNRLKDLLEEPK